MNLGLFRRENLQSGDSKMVGDAVVDQFQRTHGALTAWQEVEHTDDGHHTDIHATSITVEPGGISVEGDIESSGGSISLEDGNVEVGDLPNEGTPLQSGGYGIRIGNWRIISDSLNSPSTPSFQGLIFQYLGEHIGNFMFRFIRIGTYDWALAPQSGIQLALGWGANRISNVITAALNCIGAANVGSLQSNGLIHSLADISAAGSINASYIGASVAYYERGAGIPLGWWQDVPYNPAYFLTVTGGAWTVTAGNYFYRFTVIGKTMFINFRFVNTSVAAGALWGLACAMPPGYTIAAAAVNQNYPGLAYAMNNGVVVTALPLYILSWSAAHWACVLPTNWAASAGATHVYGSFTVEIA